MEWLSKHSPQVLAESRKSEVTIFQALFRFNNFLRKALKANRYRLEEMGRLYESDMSELVVWGNGAVADNTCKCEMSLEPESCTSDNSGE